MSEAELRIKCGAEIYSSNNNNNNESGNEDESKTTATTTEGSKGNNWTKLPPPPPSSPLQPSPEGIGTVTQLPPPVRPFIPSDNPPGSPPTTPSTKPLSEPPVSKSPPAKKIRLPLTPKTKGRKESSIPVGIAVARQRTVTTREGVGRTTQTPALATTMSSQPRVVAANAKTAKRASPHRLPQLAETLSATPPKPAAAERQRKTPSIVNKSNMPHANANPSAASPVLINDNCGGAEPRGRGNSDSARNRLVSLSTASEPGALTQLQPPSRHPNFVERSRLNGENGVGGMGMNGQEYAGYGSGGFPSNPHFVDWTGQLNVPHLPTGYNAVAAAYLQQQHQQLSMHPDLQLSQSYGYNLSPYLYSTPTPESLLHYEQYYRQQQLSREDQLRLQQRQFAAAAGDYAETISRSAAVAAFRSLTPIPTLSPRISIPSPSPTPHHLYSNPSGWPADLYPHAHSYLTSSSTATLSPRSLTSSTPSPVTVSDSHSYFLARKCITPNPIGVGSGAKHFPFSSPFSPSLPPGGKDGWKDVKISPISKKPLAGEEVEVATLTERSKACPTPGSGSPRHDFRRMESLIEKRAEGSVGNLLHSPTGSEKDPKLVATAAAGKLKKVCDGGETFVPEAERDSRLESTAKKTSSSSSTKAPKEKRKKSAESTSSSSISSKKVRKATGIAKPVPCRPPSTKAPKTSSNSNDTQKGNLEKYFIPVKREFGGYGISTSGNSRSGEQPWNYSTKAKSQSNPSRTKDNDTLSSSSSSRREAGAANNKIPSLSSDKPKLPGEKKQPIPPTPVDISRVKREVVGLESIYRSSESSGTSAAEDEAPTWRQSRRPETQGCSQAEPVVNSGGGSSSSRKLAGADTDIFRRILDDSGIVLEPSDQEQLNSGQNLTVTVNLPQEGMEAKYSPMRERTVGSPPYSDSVSFPKIVISSEDSHLNLLATVAQEIGPYISVNTNRSPRRYESLIQIEPAAERRPSTAGSCGSGTTISTLSRLSIDENFPGTPNLPLPHPVNGELNPISITNHQDSIFEAAAAVHALRLGAASAAASTAALPYQLKIPQIIPRLQSESSSSSKPVKKRKLETTGSKIKKPAKEKQPKKPKINKKLNPAERKMRVGRERSAAAGKKPKTVKPPPPSKRKASSNISISEKPLVLTKSLAQDPKPPKNPSIYDFDLEDTKPNLLEPLYTNRLEKPGQPPKQRLLFPKSSPISDLKSKPQVESRSSSKDEEVKVKVKNEPKEKPNKKQLLSKETEANRPANIPLPRGIPSSSPPPPPSMQIQSILTTTASPAHLAASLAGHESSGSESSMWMADPVHAVTAIIPRRQSFPRRMSAEVRALRKRRRPIKIKPSQLTLLNGSEERRRVKAKVKAEREDQEETEQRHKNSKLQLKPLDRFTSKKLETKKNGHNTNHHHIRPCLKAEPEFREGSSAPSSEDEEEEGTGVGHKPVATVEPTPQIPQPKPMKIRKPSVDMNIFSRRVRNSEDSVGKTGSGGPGGKDEQLDWNENVVIAGVEEMLDEMRILTEIQGLFYTGKLNALQPPDVYGVTLDNERGAPPHLIYSAEEVLEKCIREAKPWKASQLPHGLRICAYWSPQYSGLYPGKVSTDYDTLTDLVPVEFDDGDTGVIKIGEIRLLASNHPIREYDPNPLLTLEKKHRKRRHSSATGSQGSGCNGLHEEPDCGESYCAKVAKKDSEEEEAEMSDDEDDTRIPGSSKFVYWSWSGLGYRRPGTKKNRNKEFFHGIQRGDEVIKVGDSALFISNGNVRPFLGRIERFWEKKGKKVVNVRWFYHPEEVKTRKKLSGIKYPGALFESPHIDENDVQTIARKCEVLPFEDFREKYGARFTSKSGRSLSSGSGQKKGLPKDTYYLAGYYDPYTYNLQLNDLK